MADAAKEEPKKDAEPEEAAAEEEKVLTKEDKKEAEARRRKAEKQKKRKEKKKEERKTAEKGPAQPPKQGKGKAGGKGKPAPKVAPKDDIDDIDVDYVVPEVLEGSGMEVDPEFAAVMERFKHIETEKKEGDDDEEGENKKKRTKPKASLLEEAEDSDEENDDAKLSKKKRKVSGRMSVAELKTLVRRPDVVEVWDTTSADPRLLVYLKAYRNTVNVPKHWSSKRKYMAGKRGVEKPPFKLPEFIEATGIAKIRQSIIEKQAEQGLKAKSRDKAHPKMGKLDIDYQVLHDAFFKYMTKPKLTKHNELYHEGKEYEAKMMNKKPGNLSAALKEALGMDEKAPPPWLINMQRYGPPPAYPNLKVPGLNAPIPEGAEYGYHAGGWGKPPVDEFGNPLYGDWKQDTPAAPTQPEDITLWGEVDDFDEDEEEDEPEGAEKADGMATPMMGTATPLVGSGSATPMVSMDGGVRSISGVSSITSGMDTPGAGSRSKRGGIASVSGVSSASLTPTPQLFQVLEEQKARSSKGVFGSSHGYKVGAQSSGTGTPLAGIGTPIGGIGTPHGISTPHGIGTPGIGTRTPIGGIGTPVGGYGTRSAGIGTPVGGIGTPAAGISTPIGGIATPIGGIATPVGGIATPVGGIATPVGGIATPVGGVATPVGGIATPTGIAGVGTPAGGMDTPGPVTMSLNPQEVETEGILTADIIRQQLKQHEEAASKAKMAAGQREVEPRKAAGKDKKKKEKTKFKF